VTQTGTLSESYFPELTRRLDGSAILGYLNFSDGRLDLKFRRAMTELLGYLLSEGIPQSRMVALAWLQHRAAELEQSGSAAFKDLSSAKRAAELGLQVIPQAYRTHHADLLSHQPDDQLFTPLFLAHCCEVALSQPNPTAAVQLLNDFVGYRPIAVLETRPQTEFYPHEKVAPVTLYWRGIGAPFGKYADILRAGLELLEKTDPKYLQEASLDPANIEELALDPRAVDHFHPVNKRPSVLFGEWDPHRIDNRGYYRRFVLRQSTLDALVRWASTPERLFEAGAALCGTILMGAGVSGWGPNAHDSTVTLSILVQRIARYRDDFYKTLLANVTGPNGIRLRSEAEKLKQPFAAVRQYLNQTIASERALHLQERRLSLLFAAMGYPKAARSRAENIPAPATRFAAEMRLRQTEASFAIPSGRLGDAARLLSEVEDLLRRGINCGALLDPWNILGYQGLYPIFTGREDTVRDPRAEELIYLVGRQFDLYAQGLSAAAANQEAALELQYRHGMNQLVAWWDVYASSTVSDMPRVVGQERSEAAEHVARALTLWKSGSATDLAFWRRHHEGFRTPAAFAQVIDALLNHNDYRAAQALLMTWLSVADTVPLQDPGASFFRLTYRWLNGVINQEALSVSDRADSICRFFELLEANADDRWTVPDLGLGIRVLEEDESPEEDDEEDDDPYESAYEGMSYRDSADDGEEGSVADGNSIGMTGDFALDAESERTEDRLEFLAGIARHWQIAARPALFNKQNERAITAVTEWLRTARNNSNQLLQLAERLHAVEIPEPSGGLESVMEFDRRRAVKNEVLDATVQTLVEMNAAARALAALLPRTQELQGAPATGPTAQLPNWEPVSIRLERAIASGDRGAARRLLPAFVTVFRDEPLLVCPPSDGGLPDQAIRAQTALHIMESLLIRLPKIGLLRETYQLTRLARMMERNSPPSGRRVSSFDQLFRSGLRGVTDTLLVSARDWGEEAAEDGPLAAALKQVGESFQSLWIDHSQGLRLSILESVLDDQDWAELRTFVREYGSDLFTVRFLTMANIRGILGQGIANWLDREIDAEEVPTKLVTDWQDGKLDKYRIGRMCEIILQGLVEHYDEYRDYNTTTTQSDYGDNLYILLDFLRLKVQYERISWQLRPAVLIHEVLCQRGFDRLASKWRDEMSDRTRDSADKLLKALQSRENEHALKLRTVRDRLEERFLHPLQIDRAAARVGRAALAAREGQPEDNPSFNGLLNAVLPLAEHPSGVGLDVPAWLRRLEEELRKARPEIDQESDEETPSPFVPIGFDEVLEQLKNWEKAIGD
jgi:hypothetical protein